MGGEKEFEVNHKEDKHVIQISAKETGKE